MQTARGVAFGTASTLGTSRSSDLGEGDGNGYLSRWADDLDAIADLGVRAVRFSLDWARLQPRPTELDGEWVEWYGSLLTTALGLGLEPWLTLYDGSIPTWFDDEGGFGDTVAAGSWWPRWVERAAEQFGDAAAGWVPLVGRVDNPRPVWRDTWIALRGGRRVVRPFVLPDDRPLLDGGDVSCDLVGVVLEPTSTGSTMVDDRIAERELERMGELLRMAAEEGPSARWRSPRSGRHSSIPTRTVASSSSCGWRSTMWRPTASPSRWRSSVRPSASARTTSAWSTATSARPQPAPPGSADPDSTESRSSAWDAEGLDASRGRGANSWLSRPRVGRSATSG